MSQEYPKHNQKNTCTNRINTSLSMSWPAGFATNITVGNTETNVESCSVNSAMTNISKEGKTDRPQRTRSKSENQIHSLSAQDPSVKIKSKDVQHKRSISEGKKKQSVNYHFVLRRCLPMLVKDLDVQGISDYIYQKELLDDVSFRDMKEMELTSNQIRMLIQSLEQRDRFSYEQFKECLVLSGQPHLKDALEEEEARLFRIESKFPGHLRESQTSRQIISLHENTDTARIQAYSRSILDNPVRKSRFVQTRGFKGAEKVLFNKTGLSYVLIVGEKGNGRKSIAYELMASAVRKDETTIPLIFDKMEQWDSCIDVQTDIDIHDLDVPETNQSNMSHMVIYLRDHFGKHFSMDCIFRIKDSLIQVRECAKQRHFIIMSLTKAVFLQLQHAKENLVKMSDDLEFLLNEDHIIDLSHSQYKLSNNDKLSILRQHLAEILTEDGQEQMLSESDYSEILVAAPSVGFPKLVGEFTAYRSNIEKKSSFFREPKIWQVREFERMRHSDSDSPDLKRYFTLLAVLAHPECLDKAKLQTILETNEDMYTLKNEKCAILWNFAHKRGFRDKMVQYFTDGVCLLHDSYIKETNGKLLFLGKSLERAMAISALLENPVELIKIIDRGCLCAVLRPAFTKDIPCFTLKASDKDICKAVFSRITNIFLSGCLRIISRFHILEDPDIFEEYLRYLLDEGLLSKVLESEDQESGNSLVVHGLGIIFMKPCMDGSLNITEKILRTPTWQQLSQRSVFIVYKYIDRAIQEWQNKQMEIALTESLHKENKKTYCQILERYKVLSLSTCKDHFEFAIQSELCEVALVLLKYTESGNTFPAEFKSEKLHACLQLLLATENRGFLDIARALLECGADVNYESENVDIFHQAVRDKRKDLIKEFVYLGLSPNLRDEDGQTALSVAIGKCDLDLVQLLLDLGADLSVPDSNGMRPIHVAASVGSSDILKQFLFIDENMVHFIDDKLQNPLHYSCSREIADILIQFGANICPCGRCK